MVRWKLESKNELLVICLFHFLGIAMELFKVHKGSWSYPEEAYTKFFGVPLYSGFMYASVASYMCQAWHWFNLKIDKQPNQFISILIAALIYFNFFTHHYIYDFRWILFLIVIVVYFKSTIFFTPQTTTYKMPVVLSMFLIGFFIWVAENIATFFGAWKYSYQHQNWTVVDSGKVGSWILMSIVSYIIVFELKRFQSKIITS
jgi:uncharacterized membrane protein YoaT (DUF817 family)